ncbi:hypothetical protein CPB83DRAFT_893585 [Crepidotus variabilis]|uniref:Uncharacterized protein n=1 Tax=Crepidotus variabilis TaxID=179855 RepID=A0A9P6EH33_9AGAR|nr:hypothetical protein CPB83DRAFT_893585 [Crepidotus variabilis]
MPLSSLLSRTISRRPSPKSHSSFDDIFDNRAHLMKAEKVRKPWPTLEQINELVKRACGQYIFLDTITCFVGAQCLSPVTQLDIVIGCLSDHSLFTDMDSIYRLILEQCPYQDILKVVIDNLVKPGHGAFVSPIAEIWQFSCAQVQLVVDSLAAVVMEDEGGDLKYHHLSFLEFLADEERAGKFFAPPALALERFIGDVKKGEHQ